LEKRKRKRKGEKGIIRKKPLSSSPRVIGWCSSEESLNKNYIIMILSQTYKNTTVRYTKELNYTENA
jgi:hypothetical protein